MSKYLGDLRFVIGVFFVIMGLILLGTYFIGPSDLVEGIHLNLVSGIAMFGFGSFMVSMTFF